MATSALSSIPAPSVRTTDLSSQNQRGTVAKFSKKNGVKAPARYEVGSRQYTNTFPLSKSRILIAYPHLHRERDFLKF